MKKLYKRLQIITLITLLIFISIGAYAQGGPSGPGGQPDPAGAPVDGGIVLLLLACLCYGIKIIYDKNKLKNAASFNKKG